MPWIVSVTLTIALPLVAVYAYLGRKFYFALTHLRRMKRRRAARLIVAVILSLNLFPILLLASYVLIGRSASVLYSGERLILDLCFVYPFWFSLVIATELSIILLFSDIAKLVLLPLYRIYRATWRRLEATGIFLAGLLVSIYCIVVISLNTWSIRVTRHEIPLPESARALHGLRIALIADVQGDWRTTPDRIRSFVKIINEERADMVLFAGDLISSGTRHIASTAGILRSIHAPLGTIAAVGDHDIFSGKQLVWERLTEAGFHLVEDSTISMTLREIDVSLTVLTHTYRQKTTPARLQAIRDQLDGSYKILLVHQPANPVLEYAAEAGYDLLVAGHTHGGGIAVGIPGIKLLAPAHFESRFVSGMHHWNNMHVVVTNGLGFTLAPIRFHAPAEITLLELKRPMDTDGSPI
ncbi:MAG: hypothetical protein FJ215_07790 [Ignavibacteria bacterium]|nr:hypothetical protein [Ignavibacteria bacterium]